METTFWRRLGAAAITIFAIFSSVLAQNTGNENAADRTLKGSGRINPSTLAMEFSLPLGSYPGRGINVPISLSYSSKVWRLDYQGNYPAPGASYSSCLAEYWARFGERSASGWTTSMATPYIEYIGGKTFYDYEGSPVSYGDATCPTTQDEPGYQPYYVRRILVHLPSGESHEMRLDDTPVGFSGTTTDPNRPNNPLMWDATFYAVDGSNLRYVQNSSTGTYRLLMPDGSFYDFDASTTHLVDRKATKFTDRNGNDTTYHAPNSTYPNGYWTDTLGREIEIPFGIAAPSSATDPEEPHEYPMPGMTGKYKFHWKLLKGSSAATSALTNFSESLKYYGETYGCEISGIGTYCYHDAGDVLFNGETNSSRVKAIGIFNPVLLSEIELPTGQSYKFTYDIYGRIERIYYPTGGEEHFTYSTVPTLSVLEQNDLTASANFGVVNRKVLKTSGDQTPYEWTYAASYEAPAGYKVATSNPDGTLAERYLHRGYDSSSGTSKWGYDNGLAGMAYKEIGFDSSSPRKVISQKLTHWSKKTFGYLMDWHPRVTHEESIAYDPSGSGDAVSSTVRYEYAGDLDQRATPILVNKTTQYGFVAYAGSGSFSPELPEPLEPPLPEPSPIPTPTPSSDAVKIVETSYVIYDDVTYPQWVRDIFISKNMVGLVRSSTVKNGADTVVSRSEMKYDEGWYSPEVGRGNPTLLRVWDSTQGDWDNSNNYIETRARFDSDGNQIEAWDAKSNKTTTTFDSTHNAFPVQVTSPIPSDGTHGSNTAFTTTATFDFETGLPLTTTDANDLRTEIEYDMATLRPRFTRTFSGSTQVGSTTETIYNDAPNNYWVKNRAQIDENKWAESITYFDGLGRAWKSEQVDSGGNIFTEKEFDGDGRVSRVTNPFRANETKVWTTNVYDNASRVIEVVLPDGSTVETEYGVSVDAPVGVTKQITDQAGKKRKGITNVLGQMVRVIEDPTGTPLSTDYVFDTLGNLRKTVQGEQSRYFYHDSLGRLLRAKQPEQDVNSALALTTADPITGHNQWSVGYTYDDNGNILTTTDAKDQTVTATYDNLNRLQVRNYSDSSMPDVSFYYDGKYLDEEDDPQTATGAVKGKTTGISSSVSKTNYTSFDELGRLSSHQQITDGEIYTTSYVYNLSGALIEETYPSGRVVKNTLGIDGELLQVQSRKNANFGFHTYAGSFAYDSAGAVTKMQLGNGRWETASYNNRLQITQIGLGSTDNAQDLLKLEYDYTTPSTTNNNGSLRKQTITVTTVGGTSGFTATQTYTYDDLNRIQSATETIGETETWKQTFLIDRYGNRRFDTNNNNTTTLGSCSEAICNPTISTATNRFTTTGYEYDANGNVTKDAQDQRFGYDSENHQIAFFYANNSGSVPDATYQYDGEGKRVKKISDLETTVFVYNASGQLVAEYSTQISETPQVSYLTTDHLGSPRVITDQDGNVTNRKDYTAFGEENFTEERTSGLGYSGPNETRKGYTGYEKDDESGLDFAQARYYNSTHGRYTSVDPLTASAGIKNPQTFNRYTYVLNSPYKFTDPLGLIPVTTAAWGNSCPWCLGGSTGLISEYGNNVGVFAKLGWDSQQAEPPKRPVLYVFVTLTRQEMTISEGQEPPDFQRLIEMGKKNGVEVRINDTKSGEGLSKDNTKKNMFIQALQDSNAIGVIYVGHGVGDLTASPFIAEGIDLQGTDGQLGIVELASITDVKASFIGIFGCGTLNVANALPGDAPAVALDGGPDGETSLFGIGSAGYAAASAIIDGKDTAGVIKTSNEALAKVEALNLVKTATNRLVDKGDRVVKAKDW